MIDMIAPLPWRLNRPDGRAQRPARTSLFRARQTSVQVSSNRACCTRRTYLQWLLLLSMCRGVLLHDRRRERPRPVFCAFHREAFSIGGDGDGTALRHLWHSENPGVGRSNMHYDILPRAWYRSHGAAAWIVRDARRRIHTNALDLDQIVPDQRVRDALEMLVFAI